MRKSIEDYIKKCESCHKLKKGREFMSPLRSVEEQVTPFRHL